MASVRSPLPTGQNTEARNGHASTATHRRINVGNPSARIAICLILLASVLLAPAGPAVANESASDTVTLRASVVSAIAVEAPDASPDCRMLYPAGKAGDNRSAYCAMTAPFTIRVLSSDNWSGSFELRDCATNEAPLAMRSSALRASLDPLTSYADAAGATVLKPGPLVSETSHPFGEVTYAWYLALRMTDKDNPSDFCAMLSYAATQDSGSSLTIGTIEISFQPIS